MPTAPSKESRLRPPGQLSTADLMSESSSSAGQRTQHVTPVVPDTSRTQSIQSLVLKLGSGGRGDEGGGGTPSHTVKPILKPATTSPAAAETSAADESLDPVNKTANHEAIVRHFHLRRVLEDERNATEDEGDGDYDDDSVVDGSSPYAQRMVKAAKIHEFRRMKSRRDSAMVSVSHMIPVSRRRVLRWHRRVTRRLRTFLHDCVLPFSPTGTVSKLRGVLLLLTMLLQLFVIPFVPVYFPAGTMVFDGLNIFFDVFYILDFLASCNTAYFGKPEELEFSRRKILARYVKSGWPFWIDLLSSVPVDAIIWFSLRDDPNVSHEELAGYVLAGELHAVLRFFSWATFIKSIWFVRVVRATREFWLRVVSSRLSYGLAAIKIVLLLLFVTHYVACMWRFTLITTFDSSIVAERPWETYVGDLYYAAQLLQGQGVAVHSVGESIYGSIAVLVGYLVIAFITGCISLVLINYQSNSSTYQRKLEMVFATMDKMQLPPQLCRRIHQYYNHLWFEHDSIDGDIAKFSHELSRSLGLEVRLFKYMDLVLSVSYWRNSSADFVTQIMLSLDVRAYLPEDYIVRQGEVGDGLFLINRGLCELTSCPAELPTPEGAPPRTRNSVKTAANSGAAEGAVNMRRLMAGHSFGELALLMNYRRTADVRAVSYVEMCVLDRRCFQKLLIRYREDRREVLRELIVSCIEKSGMRFIAFPWEGMVDRILRTVQHPSKATSYTQLTPWEAADLIVDLITPEGIADETVTFGFHDFDSLSNFTLTPITMSDAVDENASSRKSNRLPESASSCSCYARVETMEAWQQQTLDRLVLLESTIGELVAELRTNRQTK